TGPLRAARARPSSSTATAVSECLCTSTPITIIRLASTDKKGRPASGQTSIEAKATLLSGHTRRSREGGGDTTLASRQKADIRESSHRRQPELSNSNQTPHPYGDIEFRNVAGYDLRREHGPKHNYAGCLHLLMPECSPMSPEAWALSVTGRVGDPSAGPPLTDCS